MTYTLSTNAILDTLYAMAALHNLTTESPEPILDPDRTGPVKLMVKNAFAAICLQLMPYMVDCNLDSESATSAPDTPAVDDADILMTMTLAVPRDIPDRMHPIIRRNIEQAVAHYALGDAIMASGDTVRANSTMGAVATFLNNIRSILSTDINPIISRI